MKTYDEIVKLLESKGLTKEDIDKKVKDKIEEFSNLISKEGAIYIVAAEENIDLKDTSKSNLKIKNILPGMKNVEVVCKILKISDIKEFNKSDGKGKVCSIYVGDETGSIRLTLWDNETDIAKELNVGDVVKIYGYTRKDNLELRLGRYGKIVKVNEKIEAAPFRFESKRGQIADLSQGERKELRASIVKMFESNPIFYRCPKCGKRVIEENGVFKCPEHGEVEPVPSLVVSGIIDDGSENIRAVFFRIAAEKILGMKTAEVIEKINDKKSILKNVKLGKDYIFSGRVKKNDMFDRLEFIVDDVREPNMINEIESIMKKINGDKND